MDAGLLKAGREVRAERRRRGVIEGGAPLDDEVLNAHARIDGAQMR